MALSRNTIVPLVVACAFFMEQIDSSVITTAIPRISESLGADPLHLSLAVTAYMFSLAIFIPLSGWIADRFGARNVFRLAIVAFVVGSLACGFSNSLWELVLSRIFQGLGGAMMVPVGRLVLLKTVPKSHLVDAMALMTAPALAGPILGPPIGGFIATYASWRWIFFINLPLGLLGLYMATRYIEDFPQQKKTPLDLQGFVLMAVSLAGLIFVFEMVGRNIVPVSMIFVGALISAISFVLYLKHSKKIRYPIIDLRPLLYPTYRAAIAGGSLFRIAIGAMPFLFPLLLQYGFGLSPVMSGSITLAGAAGAIVMKIMARPLVRVLGFRPVLVGGAILNALFFVGCAYFTPQTPLGFIFAFLLVGGILRSLQFTALNAVAYADIPNRLLSRANTLYTTMQQLSLSTGVALSAFILNISLGLRGETVLAVDDFMPAFWGLAALSLLSIGSFLPLRKDAGAVVRGQRLVVQETSRKDPV